MLFYFSNWGLKNQPNTHWHKTMIYCEAPPLFAWGRSSHLGWAQLGCSVHVTFILLLEPASILGQIHLLAVKEIQKDRWKHASPLRAQAQNWNTVIPTSFCWPKQVSWATRSQEIEEKKSFVPFVGATTESHGQGMAAERTQSPEPVVPAATHSVSDHS